MSENARRFDLEVQVLREALERERTRAEQLASEARHDDATEITRIGVDLNELRRQFAALAGRVASLEAKIVEVAASAAAITRMLGDDARARDARQRVFNWLIGAISGTLVLLLIGLAVLTWRLW